MFAQGLCTQGYRPSLLDPRTWAGVDWMKQTWCHFKNSFCNFLIWPSFRLSSNNFRSSAVCVLKNTLIHSKTRYLSLHDNPVLGANLGGQALAEVICNPCIQEVNLENTNATTATVHHFLAELHRCKSIQKLNLSRNKISDGIVEVLAASLNKRHSLRLHPGGNR